MRKKTKALSGASKDAYLRRVLGAYPELAPDTRKRLLARLREDITQLRVRLASSGGDQDRNAAVESAAATPVVPAGVTPAAGGAAPFDPFTPNVIVVLRRSGRDAALQALEAIDNPDDLRLLAREQRLTVAAGVTSAAELRVAIVAAAERRVANRLAAAS